MAAKKCQKVVILPSGRSGESYITTLIHPRTSKPTRYLVDPHQGIYEFTRVTPVKATYRSWLLLHQSGKAGEADNTTTQNQANASASIISKPDLLVATPIDPLFLILPALYSLAGGDAESKELFLSGDDVLDHAYEQSPQLEGLSRHEFIKANFLDRLSAVCDTVEAGDETMFRLNERKLLDELLAKAQRLRASGLPKSMEEKFIRGALDLPMGFLAREVTVSSDLSNDQAETSSETVTPPESQSSNAGSDNSSLAESAATGVTTPDTADSAPLFMESAPSPDLVALLRLRMALRYILSSYVAVSLAAKLQQTLDSEHSPVNFKPLDDRIALVSKSRAQALAARSASDFSRKRNAYEDDEMVEERAEKKRKKEEDEKRKKQESRGIKNLRKADTSGMKKLSSFFGKKVAAKS